MPALFCQSCGSKNAYSGIKPHKCQACDEPFESVVTSVKPTKSGQAAVAPRTAPRVSRPAGPRRIPRDGDDPAFQAAVEAAVQAQLQRTGMARHMADEVPSDNDFDLSEITSFDGIKMIDSESQLGTKTTTDKLKGGGVSFERASAAESLGVGPGSVSPTTLKSQIIQEMLRPTAR